MGATQAIDRANQVGDGMDDFVSVAEERGDYENPDEGIGGIEGEAGGGEGEIDRLAGLGSLGGFDMKARSIQDQSSQARGLNSLAKQATQNLLPTLQNFILDLTHKPTPAQALSSLLPYLPPTNLPYSDWKTFLHLLASRNRSNLMPNLATLYPAIQHLGGETAMPRVVESMRQVCSQWK